VALLLGQAFHFFMRLRRQLLELRQHCQRLPLDGGVDDVVVVTSSTRIRRARTELGVLTGSSCLLPLRGKRVTVDCLAAARRLSDTGGKVRLAKPQSPHVFSQLLFLSPKLWVQGRRGGEGALAVSVIKATIIITTVSVRLRHVQ